MPQTEMRQDVYSCWLENSEVSVQRSNNRHLVKISIANIRPQILDLIEADKNISEMTKRGKKRIANRYVADKTYCEIHSCWMKLHKTDISYGTFFNLKPFYVTAPTEKEMDSCLYSKCLNPHTVYKSLRRAVESQNLPKSQSEYLCKDFKCDQEDIGNQSVECIQGSCGHCKIVDIKNLQDIDWKRRVLLHL